MAIIHNFFKQHTPLTTWLDVEDRDEIFTQELNLHNTYAASDRGVWWEQVLRYLSEIAEFLV